MLIIQQLVFLLSSLFYLFLVCSLLRLRNSKTMTRKKLKKSIYYSKSSNYKRTIISYSNSLGSFSRKALVVCMTIMILFTFSNYIPLINLIISIQPVKAAAFNDAATGNWNVGATWGNDGDNVEGSGYPGSGDTVTIDSHTVTLTGNQSNAGVTISGGVLELGSNTLTITGGWTFSSGTFTPGTGTVDFVATSMTITGATTFYNLTFSGSLTSTQNISDDLTVTNDLTITRSGGGTKILADGSETHTISVAGNVTHSGEVGMEGDLTIVMNGSGTQTVTTSGTFGKIGGLEIDDTSAHTVELGSNLLMQGLLTIDAGSTLDVTTSNYNITNTGGWTRNGTFTPREGTVDFIATTMTITGATTFYNLTFSGSSNTNQNISDDLTVTNDLTITRSHASTRIFADGSETHTISVAGNVTHSGTTSMEDDLTIVMDG